MALIIITVELSIDSLHTIVGNPQKQYITKKSGTCFWRAHLQSLGGLGSVEKACGLNYLFLSEHL